jgi:hypothetical protein
MFNNDNFGRMLKALKHHFFNQIDEDEFLPTPPPSNYFLLDNTGENLFDNPNDPFLVE